VVNSHLIPCQRPVFTVVVPTVEAGAAGTPRRVIVAKTSAAARRAPPGIRGGKIDAGRPHRASAHGGRWARRGPRGCLVSRTATGLSGGFLDQRQRAREISGMHASDSSGSTVSSSAGSCSQARGRVPLHQRTAPYVSAGAWRNMCVMRGHAWTPRGPRCRLVGAGDQLVELTVHALDLRLRPSSSRARRCLGRSRAGAYAARRRSHQSSSSRLSPSHSWRRSDSVCSPRPLRHTRCWIACRSRFSSAV
jgi:hypothetical protein